MQLRHAFQWYVPVAVGELLFLNLMWLSYETVDYISYGQLSGTAYGVGIGAGLLWAASLIPALIVVLIAAGLTSKRPLLTVVATAVIVLASGWGLLSLRL